MHGCGRTPPGLISLSGSEVSSTHGSPVTTSSSLPGLLLLQHPLSSLPDTTSPCPWPQTEKRPVFLPPHRPPSLPARVCDSLLTTCPFPLLTPSSPFCALARIIFWTHRSYHLTPSLKARPGSEVASYWRPAQTSFSSPTCCSSNLWDKELTVVILLLSVLLGD